MTSALAAALLELDRARDLLEKELSQNPDFVALRRLDQANSDDSRRQCQALTRRLESLPVFRALQALAASRDLIDGCDAMLMEERKSRQSTFSAAMPVIAGGAPLSPALVPPSAELPAAEPVHAAIRAPAAAPALAVLNPPVQPPSRDDIVRATGAAAATAIAAARRHPRLQPQPPTESATADASTPPPAPAPPTRSSPTSNAKSQTAASSEFARQRIAVDQLPTPLPFPLPLLLPLPRPSRPPMPPPAAKRDTRLSPLPQAAEASANDDLRRIEGIDAAMVAQLRHAGITAFRDIAGWRAADVARIAQLLAVPARRIGKQGWIEQAALLATGVETEFDRRASGRAMVGTFAPTGAMMSAGEAVSPNSDRTDPSRLHSAALSQPTASLLPRQPGRLQAPADALPRVPLGPPLGLPARLRQVETKWRDEAAVTIIAQPPAVPSPASAAAGASVPSQPPAAPAERWMAPATSEEAVVEIVRRVDPTMPANRAAEVDAVLQRVSSRPVLPPPRHMTPPNLQPTWVSEQDVVAGGVMRRFLKALKRDA